jgi:hypothetical protein
MRLLTAKKDKEQKKEENAPVQFRLALDGEMAVRFNRIKKKYGLESNADLVRLLITNEYERIASGRT